MGTGNYKGKCDDLQGNIMNDTLGCSRATQVLMELHETVKLTEFHPRHSNQKSNLLAFALDVQTHKTTIKIKIAANRKTYEMFLIQQPNRLELMLHGEQNQVCQTGEVCWKY